MKETTSAHISYTPVDPNPMSYMGGTDRNLGARGGAVGCGNALQVGRSRVRFPIVSLELFIDIILPTALWP